MLSSAHRAACDLSSSFQRYAALNTCRAVRHSRATSGTRSSFGLANDIEQLLDTVAADRRDNPEFGQVGRQGVGRVFGLYVSFSKVVAILQGTTTSVCQIAIEIS